jgi:hypothetical protein
MPGELTKYEGVLTPFVDGVWLASEPVRIVGMKLTSTMAVVQLPGSRVLLYSPVPMTKERRAVIETLGTVAHVYAPNTFHHMWASEWASAFPDACVHGPEALRTKRPDLRIDRLHDRDAIGELGATFDEVHIDGFRLEESVLVHRPSKSLLVADLVHNVGRPIGWWSVTYSKAMGFYDRVAISRMLRLAAFNDRAAAKQSLERVLSTSFDRLVVGHGTPLDGSAGEKVRGAYEWL